jgi:aspartate-semialdehyde dehydrogenase
MALVDSKETGVSVAVIGATGALGSDLISVISQSELPVRDLRLMAGTGSAGEFIEADERRFRVHAMPESSLDSALFEGVDLVFFAATNEVTKKHGYTLAEEGIGVIDIGGALAGDLPFSAAGMIENVEVFAEHRIACTPAAPTLMLLRLLEPLLSLDLVGIRANAMLSASSFGRKGMDELSLQVTSLFNGQEGPRTVFPGGLAFDLISTTASESGWTGAERRISVELATLLRIPPQQLVVGICVVPTFSGIALTGQLLFSGECDLERAKENLGSSPWLHLSDPPPGPKRIVGRDRVYVGRLREDPMGDGLHFWASGDNLRAGASTNAVALAHRYWEEGLV